jgi:hypothetical protein
MGDMGYLNGRTLQRDCGQDAKLIIKTNTDKDT